MILQSYNKKQYRYLQHAVGNLNPLLTIQEASYGKFCWYRRRICPTRPQGRAQ